MICAAALRSHGGPVGIACLRAAVVCSNFGRNKLSGAIGSWIGTMAKLAWL